MEEQADSLIEFFETQGENRPTHIVRDRDSKFTKRFCKKLEDKGIQFRPTPPRSPNMNPFAESWVRTVKHECLNHFMVLGEKHVQYLLGEFVAHYPEQRPHQGLANRPPDAGPLNDEILSFERRELVCHERLGGVLKHFERVAA
jgi:putative transposase